MAVNTEEQRPQSGFGRRLIKLHLRKSNNHFLKKSLQPPSRSAISTSYGRKIKAWLRFNTTKIMPNLFLTSRYSNIQ